MRGFIYIQGHVGRWKALRTIQVRDLMGHVFPVTEYEHVTNGEKTPHIWLDEIGQIMASNSRHGIEDLVDRGYVEVKEVES